MFYFQDGFTTVWLAESVGKRCTVTPGCRLIVVSMKLISCACCLLFLVPAVAQDSSAASKISISGFLDVYYQHDFNTPATKERPSFLYNHKQHAAFAVNLALLRVAYQDKKLKATIGLMTGDYAQYNLAAEPRLLQHVYEANIGYHFSDKISMEAGILPSHLGLENAISKDCWNLSRSLLAENSPYFETGLRMNYAPGEKWQFSLLVLNGWQNIKETNTSKAIGTQVQFKPDDTWLFNSSGFAGNERTDSIAQAIRYFHNFYVTCAVSDKLKTALLADVGTENKKTWWGTAFLLHYKAAAKFATGLRFEYYKDRKGVIVTSYPPGEAAFTGISCNADYTPSSQLSFRAEARWLRAALPVFEKNGDLKNTNFCLLGSIAVSF